MRVPIFSAKGVFLAVCLGKIFPTKSRKGGVFKPISRDMGYFSKASKESIKETGMSYTYMFPALSIASREMWVGPLLYYLTVVGPTEGNGKIRIFCKSEEKKISKRKAMGVTYGAKLHSGSTITRKSVKLTNNGVRLAQTYFAGLISGSSLPEWSLAPMDPFPGHADPGVLRVYNVPEIGGQLGKSAIERGWILYGKILCKGQSVFTERGVSCEREEA